MGTAYAPETAIRVLVEVDIAENCRTDDFWRKKRSQTATPGYCVFGLAVIDC
jgi:hypothetical protein